MKLRVYRLEIDGSDSLSRLVGEGNYQDYDKAKTSLSNAIAKWLPEYLKLNGRELINDYERDDARLGYKRQFVFKFRGYCEIVLVIINPTWLFVYE